MNNCSSVLGFKTSYVNAFNMEEFSTVLDLLSALGEGFYLTKALPRLSVKLLIERNRSAR